MTLNTLHRLLVTTEAQTAFPIIHTVLKAVERDSFRVILNHQSPQACLL